jgi:hypothetical protein
MGIGIWYEMRGDRKKIITRGLGIWYEMRGDRDIFTGICQSSGAWNMV